jgi:hypothetical protein
MTHPFLMITAIAVLGDLGDANHESDQSGPNDL